MARITRREAIARLRNSLEKRIKDKKASNQHVKELIAKKKAKIEQFEIEYQNFVDKLKAEQTTKETVVVELPKVEPEVVEEPILSPEQTYVEIEVTEPAEPIKVDVIEEVIEKPTRKSKKKKVETDIFGEVPSEE